MTSPDRREDRIIRQAQDRPPTERAAFLEGACAGDVALRQRVEALLAVRTEAGDSLGPTVADPRTQGLPAEEGPGTVIGRYRLLEKIGEGGFGAVYAAEQREPVKRRVALKIIKLGMDTRQVVARFESERQALALMDHPNIAKVLDGGATEAGRPYFVMELVQGIPMTEYCDQNRLSTEKRLKLFIQVCQAIQHAHQKGIIHRDIKPSNILVTVNDGVPVPKVIDFGIAKATQGDLTDKTVYTQLQQFIGTPAYMSPEQAEMSSLDIDTRSDIYSLGVLMYELLVGRTPFELKELLQSGFEAMRRTIREKEPVRPSTRLGNMPDEERTTAARRRAAEAPRLISLLRGDLDWIAMKCLEKDRTLRYDTANGLAMDVQRHLSNEPVIARPPSAAYRFQKAWRRNKLVFTAAAAVAAALILGVIASTWEAVRATRAEREQNELRQVAVSAKTLAEQAQAGETRLRQQAQSQELAARRRAYAADMNILHQALRVNNLRRARQLLDRHRPRQGEPDLRGWEWRYLWQRCRGDAQFKLSQQPIRVLYAAFTSDEKRVAAFDDGGRISLWDLTTGKESAQLQGRVFGENQVLANSGQATVSADGELMAAPGIGQDSQPVVKVWRLTSQEMVAELPSDAVRIVALAFSPNAAKLAVYNQGKGVFVWNIDTKALDVRLPVARARIFRGAVTYSPDGKILTIGDTDGRVRLIDAASGSELAAFSASKSDGVMALAFSPDGRWLAVGVGTRDPVITVWDVASRSRSQALVGHAGFVSCLCFSPDGQTLASASTDETIKLWSTSTWKEEATLLGHSDEVWSIAFSRDSKQLLSTGKDGAVFVWSASPDRIDRGFASLPAPVEDWVASPDGGSIATVGVDGIVSIWDAATLEKKKTLPVSATRNSSLFWPSTDALLIGDSAQVQVWNSSSATFTTHSLNTGGRPAVWGCFLPKPGTLVVGCTNTGPNDYVFRSWNLTVRKEMSSFLVDHRVNDLAVSSDQPLLAIGTDHGAVMVRNIINERVQNSFNAHPSSIQGLAFVPGTPLLATASPAAPTIKVWDLSNGKEVVALASFNLVIACIATSPDGQRLAASSIGQEPLKIWDTTSWEEVANLEGSGASLSLVRFFPDGNTLAAFDVNHILHLWRAPSWAEIEAAEKAEAKAQER